MPIEMDPDRDHNSGLDQRRLTFDCSVPSTLPQRDPSRSVSETSSEVVDENRNNEIHCREFGYCNKKRTRGNSSFFRSGVLLCPYIVAIIFLLAGTPSVVRAQGPKNDVSTMAPSVSVIAGPTVPDSVTDPSPSVPPIPFPTTAPSKIAPTVPPTRSISPSFPPTDIPSYSPTISPFPSSKPTPVPTGQPSWAEPSSKETKFRQEFEVGNGREFNTGELNLFKVLYQRYTINFAPISESEVELKIITECTIDKQTFLFEAGERKLGFNDTNSSAIPKVRGLEDAPSRLNVDYTMKYESRYYNVTNYPKLFQNWTTNNLDEVKTQMQVLGMNVTEVKIPKRIVVSTPSPTTSPAPSMTPTIRPSISAAPSPVSTENPSAFRGTDPPVTTTEGFKDPGSSSNIIIISVSSIIALTIILIGIFLYCKKHRANLQDDFGTNPSKVFDGRDPSDMRWSLPNPSYGTTETKAYGSSFGGIHSEGTSRLVTDVVSSPPGSLVSNQSLISRGNSMGGDSRDEEDTAHILVDEFDQYKDQNLEKMRADIDVPECDDMVSQAVARALFDQDDETMITDFYWGGDPGITAPEIEASALGFVLDFLKRNSKVSAREKREMMQEQLNKMTASVLHKVIGPDDATRTIHECAILLGLRLELSLSTTTILITGMRKKAIEADIRRTFSVFGDVAVAAVAPNERGFGILRFVSAGSVGQAMGTFRTEEVVVDDVAVQLIEIKAGLNIDDGATKII